MAESLPDWIWRANCRKKKGGRPTILSGLRGSRFGIASIRKWSDARNSLNGSDIRSQLRGGTRALWRAVEAEL